VVDYADDYRDILRDGQEDAFIDYQKLLDGGVAKEIARINLPLSTYTEMYWQMDLHNLMHYIRLRIDSHAQEEIRVYAQAMLDLIRPIVPYAIEAYEEHVLGAVKFSRTEMEVLKELLDIFRLQGLDVAFENAISEKARDFSQRKIETLAKKLGVTQ
jgi:thymidylate synthase (FAD)